jgi:hypothetical protein
MERRPTRIAPSLGRNVCACGTAATCTATVTLSNIFAPEYSPGEPAQSNRPSLFEDVPAGRRARHGHVRHLQSVERVDHHEHEHSIRLAVADADVVSGRLFKFGVQVDF